jgi:hypothetical protein
VTVEGAIVLNLFEMIKIEFGPFMRGILICLLLMQVKYLGAQDSVMKKSYTLCKYYSSGKLTWYSLENKESKMFLSVYDDKRFELKVFDLSSLMKYACTGSLRQKGDTLLVIRDSIRSNAKEIRDYILIRLEFTFFIRKKDCIQIMSQSKAPGTAW